MFQITLMVWLKASDSTLFDSYDIIINNGNNSYKCLVINLGGHIFASLANQQIPSSYTDGIAAGGR